MINELNQHLTSVAFETCWQVWVELADRDDARVREAVVDAVGLSYGAYDGVAFESASGTQFFRPQSGSQMGDTPDTVPMPARVLTFTLPNDAEIIAKAIEAVRYAHSYQEPVIILREVLASRAKYDTDRENPNRWWNRSFDV